jgi:hypothetical protein
MAAIEDITERKRAFPADLAADLAVVRRMIAGEIRFLPD